MVAGERCGGATSQQVGQLDSLIYTRQQQLKIGKNFAPPNMLDVCFEDEFG